MRNPRETEGVTAILFCAPTPMTVWNPISQYMQVAHGSLTSPFLFQRDRTR